MDVARIVRSKNAGPTQLTLDVLFADEAGFRRGLAGVTAQTVAQRYGRAASDITVIPYPPAFALKIVMPRPHSAGAPGDRDVYGAQQHGPLLELPV
jgi:hypothetical protein